MITILKKEVHSNTSQAEFRSKLENKTLKTGKTLSLMNTTNMIVNDKDFYGTYKEDTLSVTRIRRLASLRFLPKLIIVFPTIESNKKFHIELGMLTALLLFFLVIALLSNLYELLTTNRFTEGFIFLLACIGLYVGLIWIEIKMYERKFNNY